MVIQLAQFQAMFGTPGDVPRGPYLNQDERRILIALARHVQASTVIEFGVQSGGTARCVLDACPAIHTYVGIDLPPQAVPALASQANEVPEVPGEAVCGYAAFRLLLADSRELTVSDVPQADLVFIDGGHDYETVKSDTELAFQVVRSGGAIVWHDYNAIPQIGVRRLIDERNQAHGDRLTLVAPTWMVFGFRD